MHVSGMIDESKNAMVPHALPFAFDDTTHRNKHVKLASAIGFLPEAPKHAPHTGKCELTSSARARTEIS